ncbi:MULTISPECIES: MFS transporter [Aeribacillus]|uniref:MFS transporter n=1 Tax=Aeribacillus TaxID=1055323 RepID=UPI000E376A0F|nr:MFS transporter [Aeribacillus composti]MED1442026.1 MFS transporter [Aeribacillus composti]REJ23607.1 MAG: MFS transporter [Bacillaceae bacterium]BBU40589.1 MFS transporter [Aeribacillus pallidus]
MRENMLNKWDRSYEKKSVPLLAIGFGLVGLDRWIISPLFPVMMNDLNLNYQDLGIIVAITGVFWGLFSIIMGGVSDKVGRRVILVPAMIIFSLLVGFTGLAAGLMSLLFIRAAMGVFEGAFCSVSVAATAEASHPKRRGFNMGVQQSTFALFGLGLGPIIATQLLGIVPSWHWVFAVVAVPGLIVAYLLHRTIREPDHVMSNSLDKSQLSEMGKTERTPWIKIFRSRNVNLSMIGLIGIMCCVFVLSAMLPNYFTDYLHFSVAQMGFVISGIGFGGFLGQLILPGISDLLGRKTTLIAAFILAIIVLLIFMNIGAQPVLLFMLLFILALLAFGSLCLMAGPVPVESVPPSLAASAAGIPIGIGEIFGGGVMPALSGFIAQNYGIEKTLLLALGGLIVCLGIVCFIKETAPTKVKKGNAVSI